ncbi:MAG: secretin N-terminal domain-containing protein [Gemmatimonadota bacterium]|nr:secretin N-terminal domain-containing protein [Gemmatimonadota bacterium]
MNTMSGRCLPLGTVVRLVFLSAALLLAALSSLKADMPDLRERARRISVDFHEADVRSVLMAFSEFSGVSIISSKNVTGDITARIMDEPWDKALYSLLDNNGLAVRERDGILNVDTIENIRATEKLEDLVSRIFKLNFQKSVEIAPTVSALLSERGKLQADEGSNALIVVDIPDRIDKIKEVLKELDSEILQVQICVQLSFINSRKLRELGIDWSASNLGNPLTDTRFDAGISGGSKVVSPYGSLAVGTVRKGVNLAAVINALEDMNEARTIARPVITTLNNLPAKVLVGSRTPLRVVDYGATGAAGSEARATSQLVETGVKLQVTPQITENGKILIQILAENSDAESGPDGVFFKTQEADTRLLLADGASGVIAGLTVTSDSKVISGVPGLKRVPVLGRLFSYEKDVTEKEELVIVIQAHIIEPSYRGAEKSIGLEGSKSEGGGGL